MSIVKEEFDDTSGRLDQRRFLGYPHDSCETSQITYLDREGTFN
jgi:hypothetical protein